MRRFVSIGLWIFGSLAVLGAIVGGMWTHDVLLALNPMEPAVATIGSISYAVGALVSAFVLFALAAILDALLDLRTQGHHQAGLGGVKQPAWGRASLGVDVTPEPTGLRVRSVEGGSQGDQAGLQRGDLIGSVNGTVLGYLPTASARIEALAHSAKPTLEVWRAGGARTIAITEGALRSQE